MAIRRAYFITSKRWILLFLFMLSQVINGHDEDEHTPQYTNENFSAEIKKKNHFVMFYAPWWVDAQIYTILDYISWVTRKKEENNLKIYAY